MSNKRGTIVTETIISCPQCIKEKRKRKLGGKIGKLEIKIGNNGVNSWSSTKKVTCPVCQEQVRFKYLRDERGKIKIRLFE